MDATCTLASYHTKTHLDYRTYVKVTTTVKRNAQISAYGSVIGVVVEHGLRSAPTQYRLYGRPFLQVKRPNQQYQSSEGNLQNTNQRT